MAKKVVKKIPKVVAGKKPKQMPKKKLSQKWGVPVGVKIISVLCYIVAIIYAVGGIFLLLGIGTVGFASEAVSLPGWVGVGLVFLGILLVAFGALALFVGRGLWKGRNWARIVAIVFSVLGVISAMSSLLIGNIYSGIFMLAVYGIVGGYLAFSNEVKRAFS